MKRIKTCVSLALAAFLWFEAFSNFPILRWVASELNPAHRKETPIAARVSGHPITRSQLQRAISERLWLVEKSADLAQADLKRARDVVLQELIDHELLDLQIQAASPSIPVSDGEINQRLRRLSDRFENRAVFDIAMKSQGVPTDRDLRNRLAAQIREEKFIEQQIGSAIKVTVDEARKWFQANAPALSQPERVEVRHIFLPTLDHPPEVAKQKLDEALVSLTEKKKDFATLARELSEDPATKDIGGTLGWMTRDRLPTDFSAPLFSFKINQPQLLRTKLGWHLVEVTARKSAEPRTFEEAKPEILSALDASKRRHAIKDFRMSLRNSESAQIEILPNPD